MFSTIKVYIFTEGGQNIGFGHITRCLSLYQAFISKGIIPKIIVNGDNSILDLLKNTNYKIINWVNEIENILHEGQNLSIAIIDSYLASSNIYKIISEKFKICGYIDDYNRIEYPRGVVINGAISADSILYQKNKEIAYLLGINYQPLRKVFWESEKKSIKEKINSIMITFGGDDIRNVTPNILRLISNYFHDIDKKVIIGKGFKNIEEIKNNSDKNTELIYYPDEEKIKKVMSTSDIAISAAGQTLYELAKVGTTTIAICIADNQNNNVKGWIKEGIISYAGNYKDNSLENNIIVLIDKIKDFNVRKLISEKSQNFIDGKGSFRVSDYLINLL